MPSETRVLRPSVIVGTAAVALILGGGRWASNLGSSPIFLTDILILLGLISWVVADLVQGAQIPTNFVPSSRPSYLLVAFFVFVIGRALLSISYFPFLDWIRDSAPFFYAFLAFVSASTFARASPDAREKSMKIFWWALSIHLVWMIAVTVTKFPGVETPLGEAPIFQARPDIEAAILGIGAGLYLRRWLLSRNRILPLLACLASIGCVLLIHSRAGLISVGLSLLLSYFATYATLPRRSSGRAFMQAIVPVVIVAALVVLPLTEPGQRLIATLDPSQARNAAQINAQGTERARELVWAGVIQWTNENTERQLIGSGFGNDFLSQSNTLEYLEGTTYDNVRSPHNWFIGIYARLGLIGLALAAAVCAQLIFLILRNLKRLGDSPIILLAGLIVVGILPVASFGVVLEAPFGAVPFWWAAGIIFCLASERSRTKRFETRPSLSRPRSSDNLQSLRSDEQHRSKFSS